MARYAQDGIKHFYFMMLQKEEVRNSAVFQNLVEGSVQELHYTSLSTPREKAISADLPIIVATPTAMYRNGL